MKGLTYIIALKPRVRPLGIIYRNTIWDISVSTMILKGLKKI